MLNNSLINFSESPEYLDSMSLAEIEKKVESLAHALANYVFPVPGG